MARCRFCAWPAHEGCEKRADEAGTGEEKSIAVQIRS
jgi:hypothetical protein